MKKITYEDKENLISREDVPNKNKVTAEDINEIKEVVNGIADNVDNIYPIGSYFFSNIEVTPNLPGTWVLETNYKGGELLAYGFAFNPGTPTGVAEKGEYYAFANTSIFGSKDYHKANFGPEVLTFEQGTFKVNTLGIVGMVEAFFTVSGYGTYGFWFGDNGNALPTGVYLYPYSVNKNGPLLSSSGDGNYGGNTCPYMYCITSTSNQEFYVNPKVSPYNGVFRFGHGGTTCQLQVKVYARGGMHYAYRRVS